MRVCERVSVLFFAMAKFKVHAFVVIIVVVVVVNVDVVVVVVVAISVADHLCCIFLSKSRSHLLLR